ncbi:MAG: tyrosine-type recombinase/integrase [Pirellulales bacterium]|nr:tyrosine-type recombinase/integrase [Pirellulales bacterium]
MPKLHSRPSSKIRNCVRLSGPVFASGAEAQYLRGVTDDQRKRPMHKHVAEFRAYLENRGITEKQMMETIRKLQKMIDHCKWRRIGDISANGALEYLGDLRRDGLSAQTYNHYLKAAKQFTRWLVRDRRTPVDPLLHLTRLNVKVDRRHDRRALSDEEFVLLVEAARTSKKTIEGISGPDRAMMYVLASWTGFRKGEIGSLTLRSLRLEDDPPTATVAACFSKHRREDTQVLHPELVTLLKEWLATKRRLKPDMPLFPVSGRVRGGTDRKTHKMIEGDLIAARDKWFKDEIDERKKAEMMETDFLCYCNHDGLFADFHSMRHLFITSLERAGIRPKMAQILARHNDIRLTLGVYTHIELHDQTAAIGALPWPPTGKNGWADCREDSSAA